MEDLSNNQSDSSAAVDSLDELNVETIVDMQFVTDQKLMNGLKELSTLTDLSELYVSPQQRKIHRPDVQTLIENHEANTYKQFISAFKEIGDAVGTLHDELTDLNSVCDSMAKNLWVSKHNSRNLIDEISKLETERKNLIRERNLAEAYLVAFQLDSEDLRILRTTESSADVLSADFFTVFEKIQRIQSNVSVLLNIGHQNTAVEIMDQMGLFQETALEKIYRWAQAHCKNVENQELNDVISKSLSYLQIRPMLLKYVLDEYCTHRRSLLVRSFIDTLTGIGNIKGIELIGSTDPARYIGDMLAWIHQAIPAEKENLVILLKACNKVELEDRMTTCLGIIVDGVCRPLNVRMEQTILSGLDSSVMNSVDLRIQFYVATLEQVIPGSQILATLHELQTLCHQTFMNQLKGQISSEISEYRPPGPDLQPPTMISSLLDLLQKLLNETTNSSVDQMQTLAHMVVSPLITQINEVSSRLASSDMGVYQINCLNQIHTFLEAYPNTENIRGSLKGQIESLVDSLSSEQSSWLIAQLGIGHIYTILYEKVDVPLSTVPGMDAGSLKIFANKLDTVINDPESVLLPQIIHVQDSATKKVIMSLSFKILVAIYNQIFEALADPKNKYGENILSLQPSKLEECLCNN